jgi:hypothetical protein
VHRHADVGEPRLLLRVHAEVIARRERRRRQAEIGERPAEALLDPLPHALGADVVDHELEAGLDPADAVVEVGGPGARDRGEHLDGLVLGHEDAQLLGDARHRGEPAADQHAEALLPLVQRAHERDAVDLRSVVAIRRGGDRVLVLARQVREVGVAVEEIGRLLDDIRAVEQLERVDALHRRARDVAHRVSAAARGRDARRVEVREDLGQAVQSQMVELHVLACRKLADALAVADRDLADRAQPLRLDEAGRQLDAQHERADLRLVVVEAPPLEPHDVFLGHRLVARGDQRRELVADAEGRLVALDALDGVALVDEVPVGLGSLASRSDGRAHGHLHDGMQLPPLRDTLYARRRAQADMATRVLAQTTGAPNLFQAGAIGWRISGARYGSSRRSTSSEPPGSPGLAPCPAGRLPRRHRAGTLDLS